MLIRCASESIATLLLPDLCLGSSKHPTKGGIRNECFFADARYALTKYKVEFKQEAVRLEHGGGKLSVVAMSKSFHLGVPVNDELILYCAYRWRIQNSHIFNAVRRRRSFYQIAARFRALQRARCDAIADQHRPGFGGSRFTAVCPPLCNAALDLASLKAPRVASVEMGAQFLSFNIPIYSSRTRCLAAAALSWRIARLCFGFGPASVRSGRAP